MVREEQEPLRTYTPQYGYFEIRARAVANPLNHVALWMIGYEDAPERSGEIARLLGERGWQVLITGVERERPLLDAVLERAPAARSLIGGTSLPEYAALVERAALVICGNTLPLHLADALTTPVLGLYSGTDYEEQWRPRFTSSRLLRRPTPDAEGDEGLTVGDLELHEPPIKGDDLPGY